MSDLTNLIEFKIGDKNFSFKLEENQETKKNILSIINKIVNFTQVDEKEYLNSNDYAYIIFILAVNLARKTEYQSIEQENKVEKIEKETEIVAEMKKLIEKISNLTDTP